MRTIETPILILGAGPVGLGLALDLAIRGTNCMIVEQAESEPVLHPRAGGVAARTMEFCRRWGVSDEVKACGFPRDRHMDVVFCTSLSGYTLSRHPTAPLGAREELPFTPEQRERCPQIWFDPILANAVAKRADHVSTLYRHRLLSFEQTATHVLTEVRSLETDEVFMVKARYFVACDGNDSGVRDALGVGVQGESVLSYSVNAIIKSAALNSMNGQGEGARYLFIDETGTWANMTVIDGRELWRLTLIGQEHKMDLANLDMAAVVRRAWGRDDIPFEILTIAPWRRKELNASRYQVGRVFLAGDAAHTMSPTGGAGMNTGMGDSADLGWKLAAAIEGWGEPGLLASFELERRPVGIRNARWSSGNFKAWKANKASWPKLLEDSPEGQLCRDEVGQQFLLSLHDEWVSWGIQLGYRYEGSPICVADGTAPTEDTAGEYEQTSRPGSRAPHAWLASGKSTIDLFGRGFVLLSFGGDAGVADALLGAARKRRVPLEIVRIDSQAIAKLYERKLVLVRPDGHVAWRGDALTMDALELIDTVRGALHKIPQFSPRARVAVHP